MKTLQLVAILDDLDSMQATKAGVRDALGPSQVFDERDALLRSGDEDVTERRGEDAIRERPLLEIAQPILETLSRGFEPGGGHRRLTPDPHGVLESSVTRVLPAARCAAADVVVDLERHGRLGLAGRRRDQVLLDLYARVGLAVHA